MWKNLTKIEKIKIFRLVHAKGCTGLEEVDVVLRSGIICKYNIKYYENLV